MAPTWPLVEPGHADTSTANANADGDANTMAISSVGGSKTTAGAGEAAIPQVQSHAASSYNTHLLA
jgi:hypothetical protein